MKQELFFTKIKLKDSKKVNTLKHRQFQYCFNKSMLFLLKFWDGFKMHKTQTRDTVTGMQFGDLIKL